MVNFRLAKLEDLHALIELLAADPLGMYREKLQPPLDSAYQKAFTAILADEHNELLVGESDGGVIAMLQLTYIPSLTYVGSWRCQIEGVRVAGKMRGQGVGRRLFEKAIARAKTRQCRLVQLTSDLSRPEAISFYESLGFVGSHQGFKLTL